MTADDSPQAARSLLIEGFEELPLAATAQQIDTLLELAQLLGQWSKRINLTGHRTASEIVRKLILDAAAVTAQLPEIASLADIGSGAGFPGFPVAILRADCRVTLVESRERRHHFQRQVIRQLGLDNVRAELGRAEVLEPSLHAAAIAQAVGFETCSADSGGRSPGSIRALCDLSGASGRRGADAVERAQNFRECRVAFCEIVFWGLAHNLCDSGWAVC